MTTYQSVLDALGDSTRRSVFEALRSGPRSVGDVAQRLPVSRPAVSQHLRVLKDAGLVVDRPHGTRRLYEVDPVGLGALRAYIEGFWSDVLHEFSQAAARPRPKRGRHDDA